MPIPAPDNEIRARIVAEARRYVGMPFQHQGRGRNGEGIDCAGVLISVGKTLGLLPDEDVRNYSRCPNPRLMRGYLQQYFDQIPVVAVTDGDWYYMAFSRQPQHMAMHITRYIAGGPVPYILHSYSEAGRCVEHRMTPAWRARVVEAYRYRGID